VRFKGKTIADVLEMPISEALEFFAHIPKIRRRVDALNDVGLGYMRLGQPATTLSGGEAQRVKLAAELSKVATGQTLYILDEPTTGLHFADIQRLLEVLQRLVDAGNTVVVIEHNLDVIKVADWLIDLGPEGGEEGGRVIATGTPEKVATVPESYTGAFLAEVLPVRAARNGKLAKTDASTKTGVPAKTDGPARRGAPARTRPKAKSASAAKGAKNAGTNGTAKTAENGQGTGTNGRPRRRRAATTAS
jgi:excinuclease ABC subunit A